ncbi:MAG TPA: hypothetical protein PLF26_19905, partial [Blastocatellia bacterium]|nr:hypothetical protein [Blastocatellia bacterium]
MTATPVVLTAMLCAVQSLPLRIWAANSRSSNASSVAALPVCGARIGNDVALTAIVTFPEIVGV